MGRIVFADRRDAGRQLAAALGRFGAADLAIFALPRGGVPVGYEVAKALGAPLDLVPVRKIAAPHEPELGIGAVVGGQDSLVVLDDELVRLVAPRPGYVEAEVGRLLVEIECRRVRYRGSLHPISPAGRIAIVVDDGIATGATARAALRALAQRGARRLILAVPVASPGSLASLSAEADEIVCLLTPSRLRAVGAYYQSFAQTSDQEVVGLLEHLSRCGGSNVCADA